MVRRDWCTLSPDLDFGSCCRWHDTLYARQTGTRLAADWKLARCIARHGIGHWPIALLYFLFVRVFGWYFWRRARSIMAEVNKAIPRSHDDASPPPVPDPPR